MTEENLFDLVKLYRTGYIFFFIRKDLTKKEFIKL